MRLPINKLATLVSNSVSTWYSTTSRLDAARGAITGIATATRDSVESFPRQVPNWPELKYYPAVTATNPDYVWSVSQPPDAPSNAPNTLFFAQAFAIPGTLIPNLALSHLATAEVFCDNAATLYMDEFLFVDIAGVLTVTFQNNIVSNTINGSLSDVGQTTNPPFPWQIISKFSKAYTTILPTTIPLFSQYFFVVSFEAVNYSPNGSAINPAGLQYIVELYDDLVP